MHATGVTEIIWHFAGYFRITLDHATAGLWHDAAENLADAVDDLVLIGPSPLFPAGSSQALGSVTVEARHKGDPHEPGPILDALPYPRQFDVPGVPSLPLSDYTNALSAQFGPIDVNVDAEREALALEADPLITTFYDLGSRHVVGQVVQRNVMLDDDVLWMDGAGLVPEHPTDVPATLDQLVAMAEAALDALLPDHLDGFANLSSSPTTLVDILLAPPGEDWDAGEEYSGLYVDGAPAEAAPEISEAMRIGHELTTDKGEGPAVSQQLGGNSLANLAAVFDISEAKGSLMVMGDYVETNAIFQINVLRDLDQLSGNASAWGEGGTIAHNIASFVREEGTGLGNATLGDVAAPVFWNVEVLDGDLFDLMVTFQKNWLSDNDVVGSVMGDAYSVIAAGGNEQLNFSLLQDLRLQYDLIVIAGDYYEGNYIFQQNILLDDDLIRLYGDGSAYAGENLLLNDAMILNAGVGFTPLTPEGQAVAEALAAGAPIDPSLLGLVPGDGTAGLDVLYVTGDFYELKLMHQTNILLDADTGVLVGGAGEALVSAGGNAATNVATIVDVDSGAVQYLGGEHYEDSMLVQAEIVMDVDEDVIVTDGLPAGLAALVTEASVFASESDGEPAPDTVITEGGEATVLAQSDDMMAATMA